MVCFASADRAFLWYRRWAPRAAVDTARRQQGAGDAPTLKTLLILRHYSFQGLVRLQPLVSWASLEKLLSWLMVRIISGKLASSASGGAGSPRDLLDGSVHPYTVTGHVGYSFDGGKTIFGFGPDVSGKSSYEAIQSLRNGDTYPGIVTVDTDVFIGVANNPGVVRGGVPQVVYEQKIPVTQEQFAEIKNLHDSIELKKPMEDVYYAFPGKGGANPGTCYFNCATFPSYLGVPVPESTGIMNIYMPYLERLGKPWSPGK